MKLVQITDCHVTEAVGKSYRGEDPRERLAAIIDAAIAWEPDLVALTGDLVTHHWEECRGLVEDLHALRARFGVLAVFGNHDIEAAAREFDALFRD